MASVNWPNLSVPELTHLENSRFHRAQRRQRSLNAFPRYKRTPSGGRGVGGGACQARKAPRKWARDVPAPSASAASSTAAPVATPTRTPSYWLLFFLGLLSVMQTGGLEFAILLSQPAECWDHRQTLPWPSGTAILLLLMMMMRQGLCRCLSLSLPSLLPSLPPSAQASLDLLILPSPLPEC